MPSTRCRRRRLSLPPRSLLEVVCPLARSSVGRSHAWLVRKPDLVWQILTDFLGGRGRTGNPSRSSFKRALRKGISAPPPPTTTRTNERRSQVSYRRYFARSSAAEGALLFGLMRLVGMQISSLSCRLFADGPTDARSERKAAGRKTTRAGASGGAEQPTWFHGKIWWHGGVLRFLSLSRVPLFGSFYASAPRPRRAAADSSGGGGSKKKPGQPPLSGDWRQATGAGEKGHFGTGRIWAEKGFSLVLLLLAAFICHTSQSLPSLECGVARVDCGLQKTPEPDPNYKSCGR